MTTRPPVPRRRLPTRAARVAMLDRQTRHRPAGGPPREASVPYAQHEIPSLDAALRYRATGYVPFHPPGHKLGKGAPDGLRELLGAACLRVDVAMAGGVEDTRESTHLIRLCLLYTSP